MEQDQIIGLMKAYFSEQYGPDQVENFESLKASDLIEDSVDAVTFVMHMEDRTGKDIPLAQIGPAMTGLTFRQLAGELCRVLNG